MDSLVKYTDDINALMARYGVKFGIYKNGRFKEQLFPFDSMPRIIAKDEFAFLEKGLVQRVTALNLFLHDIYHEKRIVADGVIPEDFIFSSTGFLMQCDHVDPPGGVYSHISGIDLVQAKDGNWYVLEDNLRIPSGASYPLIARKLCRQASPDTFQTHAVVDNRNYGALLKDVMDYVNTGGINVIMTPGRYNAAFFEHAFLAELTGAVLSMPSDLVVEEDFVYYRGYTGVKKKVGAIYRRISDDYLDPMTFLPESLIGVPNVMQSYKKGNVALINAPGNGVADDKGIYYFVPAMIRYYLDQEPILKNAPTYLMFYENDRNYALANMKKLVFKDVSEAGGYGVVFGDGLDEQALKDLACVIKRDSRRFIAQEVIDFIDLEIMENGQKVMRKADLRAFVLSGKEVKAWPSGLTRFSRQADSFVVNSSQGGGFKDTWILSR